MKSKLIVVLFLCIIISCKKNNDEVNSNDDDVNQNSYTVKGNLKSTTNSGSNASVILDGATIYQTKTDAVGNFEIKDVEKGMYTLSYTQDLVDSSFIGNSLRLKITNDTFISNLELPNPVLMYSPKNITSSSVDISWSKCNSQDFYEYKIFRKEDSGLDETTGKLIHVATSSDDTVFSDHSLLEGTKYYYRVYTMNNYGKLGGSKIVNIQSLNGNFVNNGSFEISDNDSIAAKWTYNNTNAPFDFKNYAKVIIDPNTPDGKHCLSVDIPIYHYALSFGDLYQLIDSKNIQSGIKYELSVWAKIIEMGTGAQCYIECKSATTKPEQRITINSSETKNVWKKYSTIFYGNTSDSYTLQVLNMCPIPYKSEPYKIIFDNIVVQKVN